MSGQGAVDAGTYGQRGVPSLSNYPPSKGFHKAFFDVPTRTMWIFGGSGGYSAPGTNRSSITLILETLMGFLSMFGFVAL